MVDIELSCWKPNLNPDKPPDGMEVEARPEIQVL
jgi:hypothetical protein